MPLNRRFERRIKGSATAVVASSFELNQRVLLLHLGIRTRPLDHRATKTARRYLSQLQSSIDHPTYLSPSQRKYLVKQDGPSHRVRDCRPKERILVWEPVRVGGETHRYGLAMNRGRDGNHVTDGSQMTDGSHVTDGSQGSSQPRVCMSPN